MKSDPAFLEKIMVKLKPQGPITSRAMFGGYGIYYDKIIFAIIVENRLFFRIDDLNRKDFEIYASELFIYDGGKKPVIMPYMTLPDEILNDPKYLKKYIKSSYEASLRNRLKKVKAAKKTKVVLKSK